MIVARTATLTTTIAPIAIERTAFTSITKRPASDTATAAPLKTTALPELASARRRASSGGAPAFSSRR